MRPHRIPRTSVAASVLSKVHSLLRDGIHSVAQEDSGDVLLAQFMSTWHKHESFWKRGPQLRKYSHSIGLWASQRCVFLIDSWCASAQSSAGVATPGLVVLAAVRKQAEQAIGIKPVNSIPPWLLDQFLFGVLPWLPSAMACYPEVWCKPFCPQLLLVTVFHLSLRKGKCGCVCKVNYQKALFSLYSFPWCDYGYMEVHVIKLHATLSHTHIHMSSVCIMSHHKKRQCKRLHVGSPYKSFKVCI